jgi:hypothetical protein
MRQLAKEINSREDILWVAYDPDMSEQEYEARKLVVEKRIEELAKKDPNRNYLFETLGYEVQASVDHRTSGLLRPVGDQQQCGSCWAFSTTHAFNDLKNILSGGSEMTDLSMQEVIECCSGTGCGACNGGYLQSSYQYMMSYGLPPDSCKSYDQRPGRCSSYCDNGSPQSSQTHFFPTGYTPVFSQGMSSIVTALAKGPTSGSLMVFEDFMLWRGGSPYYHASGSQLGGHAIEIVGYNSQPGGTSYWIIKNSWGTRWGVSGFGYIRMGSDGCGFEQLERGYAANWRSESIVPGGRFKVLDDPINPDVPPGDDVTDGDETDPSVVEAATFATSEINPIFCSGNVSLMEVLQAERQVVNGEMFFLEFSVHSPSCLRGPELFFAQVTRDIDGVYTLMNSYALGPQPEPEHMVDAMWRTVGSVFITTTALLAVLAGYMWYQLRHPKRAEQSTGYQNMNDM